MNDFGKEFRETGRIVEKDIDELKDKVKETFQHLQGKREAQDPPSDDGVDVSVEVRIEGDQ
jgi:hypothetical protein